VVELWKSVLGVRHPTSPSITCSGRVQCAIRASFFHRRYCTNPDSGPTRSRTLLLLSCSNHEPMVVLAWKQIKARLAAVFCTSCATVLATYFLARQAENGLPVRRWIGLGTNHLGVALVLPVLLTSCLFLGPLVTMAWMSHRLARNEVSPYGLSRPRVRPLPWHAVARAELVSKANLGAGTYGAIRNLVVGPIAEEVVFRGCSVPVLLGAGVSRIKIVWLSPLLFGFAHLHHALEWLRQGNSLRAVAVGMLFQIAYTSVFGAFAVFVQLRTGHLVSSILVHMLCNFMGVPDITFSIAPGNPGESTRTSVLYKHRKRETRHRLLIRSCRSLHKKTGEAPCYHTAVDLASDTNRWCAPGSVLPTGSVPCVHSTNGTNMSAQPLSTLALFRDRVQQAPVL
ncbi:unnamed protein product, partial [Ectocarpus fasciculatus]